MKKSITLVSALIAAASLLACNHKKENSGTADSVTTATPGVQGLSIDSPSKEPAVKMSEDDAKFAAALANSGMADSALGHLARLSAVTPRVRDFGRMLVTDHDKANEELINLAKLKSIVLPGTLESKEQLQLNTLSDIKGAAFDLTFANAVIVDHKNEVKAVEEAMPTLKDPQLKAFAARLLPVLKFHLEEIERVKMGLK